MASSRLDLVLLRGERSLMLLRSTEVADHSRFPAVQLGLAKVAPVDLDRGHPAVAAEGLVVTVIAKRRRVPGDGLQRAGKSFNCDAHSKHAAVKPVTAFTIQHSNS